jgi:hypothetical protein
MAYNTLKIGGKFYFVDDQTGDVYEVVLQNKTNDPLVMKETVRILTNKTGGAE